MNTHIGIDSCVFEREKSNAPTKFRSMIGCAISTDDIKGFTQLYYDELQKALSLNGFKSDRKILSSSDILTITKGNFIVHEHLFKALIPKITKMDVIYPILNSKRIPKIKVYGKKKILKELTFDEFYDQHLVNSFPHICLYKIMNYVSRENAKVFIDHFQSEETEAWNLVSKYKDLYCYINGDKTNALISIADILCRLIDNRLEENNLFLDSKNFEKILPEIDKKKLYSHLVWNTDLPKITMVHSNKIILQDYIKRPIYHIYLGKNYATLDKNMILLSLSKFLNHVHRKDGCIKFFSSADVLSMKNDDYIVCLDNSTQKEIEMLRILWESQTGIRVKVAHINNLA